MVRDHIEFVQQQRVGRRQVAHPQLLLVWQKGISLFLLLPTAEENSAMTYIEAL